MFNVFRLKSSIKSLSPASYHFVNMCTQYMTFQKQRIFMLPSFYLTKIQKCLQLNRFSFCIQIIQLASFLPHPYIASNQKKTIKIQQKPILPPSPTSPPPQNMSALPNFQFLLRVIIVLYGGIDRQTMNFLSSLFSCGRAEQVDHPGTCLSVFRSNAISKKTSPSDRTKNKEDSITVKTMSNSSRPVSSMHEMLAKKLPQPNFLVMRGCFNKKEKEINWGFLVGLVGCRNRNEKLVPSTSMCVRIGRGEQLRSLGSLRRNALDKLLVHWSELEHQFSLGELIRCRQALVFVVQQWGLLLQLVKAFEEELLKALGEFCLQESSSRIFFNIITIENKYVLEFQEAHLFKEHAKSFLEKSLGVCLEEEDFNFLIQKMTLNDYVHMRKDPQLMERKIRHYISEIQREKLEKESVAAAMQAQETVTRYHSQKISRFSEPSIKGVRKDSKESDVQLQAQYFAQNRKKGADAALNASPPEQGLLIYYFNNGQDIPQEESDLQPSPPPRTINFMRKIRSKSEDATYITQQVAELDDEFFEKYQ